MRATRLIMAMFVLCAICKPIVAGVAIKGAGNLAPNCDHKIRELCKNTTLGPLQEVTVQPRNCRAICTHRPPGPDTVVVNGMSIWNRKYEEVTLPQGMPCAFGAKCDNNGKCICRFCNEGNANKKPAST
uniref:Putative salp15 n=1 Tax=Ixodes ricinus TaxID=34613 RepID=A0A0K8RCS4_IXORI